MSQDLLWEPPLGPRVDRTSEPLPPGLHVVFGDSAGGSLKTAGADALLFAPDALTVGPVRGTGSRHTQARLAFWRRALTRAGWKGRVSDGSDALVCGRDLARAVEGRPERPVILWTTGEWRGVLFLSWALAGLAEADVRTDEIWIAGDLGGTWPLAYLHPTALGALGRNARPVDRPLRSACAALWKALNAPEPDRLELLRRRPPAALPTLRQGLSVCAALLPRVGPRSPRLYLSAFDEALLGSLSDEEPRRFPDIVKADRRREWPYSGIFAAICHYGELFIQARLVAWSSGRRPAVERSRAAGPHPFAFKLTEVGRGLLENGAESPAVFPRVELGGYSTTRDSTWVCSFHHQGWKLARWGGAATPRLSGARGTRATSPSRRQSRASRR